MSEYILVSEVSKGVCTLTLNRPEKKNALSIALRDEVTTALSGLAANSDLKVLVITGAADIFSAGFDLGEFQQSAGDAEFSSKLWESSDRFHHACLNFPLPMVAAVNGPAIAGGFDLATMCDIRVACEGAYFSHPEIAFGDVIYSLLHDLVGGAVARELCLTGRRVEAREARDLRLVSSVVARGDLDGEVAKFTEQIVQAPRENLLNTKGKILRRASIARAKTLDL